MKKSKILLAIFLTGTNTLAYSYSNHTCTTIGVRGLYWQYSSTYPDFALALNPNDLTPFSNNNSYHKNESDYDWGYQIFLNVSMPNCEDVGLAYLDYNHHFHDSLNQTQLPSLIGPSLAEIIIPAVELTGFTFVTPGNSIGSATPPLPIILTPSSSIAATVLPDSATASTSIDHNAIDLTLGKTSLLNQHWVVHWFGGIRYAKICQNVRANYVGSGSATVEQTAPDQSVELIINTASGISFLAIVQLAGTLTTEISGVIDETIQQKSRYEGIGPYFGLENRYQFSNGFSIKALIASSLLTGNLSGHSRAVVNNTLSATSTYEFAAILDPTIFSSAILEGAGPITTQTSNSIQNFDYNNQTRIVPNIDINLALNYDFRFSRNTSTSFELELGWQVSHYFNAIELHSLVDANSPEFRTVYNADADFQGPYIGVAIHI